MIKEEVVSLIMGHLVGIDKTSRWHPRFVEAEIERVIEEMLNDLWKIDRLAIDKYTTTYGVTSPIAIAQEAVSGIYYSTLPVNVYHLPDKASGVRHVYPLAQTGNVFQPMDAREADLVFNTDVAIVTSKIGYRVRQDKRIDYYNTNAVVRGTGVRMDLLPVFSELSDSDVVLIPDLGDKDGGGFLKRVLGALGVIQEKDLIDDNSGAKELNTKG